ncbi:prostate and testis expressed protein 2-like [Sciurus carolinensis]|uniref:prostate and testis expressed protein 2-like n=1 Tax=Sciurus carolinensis TaxID=30640 RepID=UPI001FB4CC7D|nr:prostate and testis expressed protein 2-like [Sciurus carolinensis]
MKNLLKLNLFLLCIGTAIALLCYQCSKFKENFCEHELRACEAVEGESCMIRRYWSFPYSYFMPMSAESNCVKDCEEKLEIVFADSKQTSCCSNYNFCNDIENLNINP